MGWAWGIPCSPQEAQAAEFPRTLPALQLAKSVPSAYFTCRRGAENFLESSVTWAGQGSERL